MWRVAIRGCRECFFRLIAPGFSAQNIAFNNISFDYTPYFDQWVHLGATVSWDGTNRITNLYINNALFGTTTTASS